MIRSYTNLDGDVVEVTIDHLDTAVRIKVELQKSSPSMRCNWKLHKKMMEEEGYYDSEVSESYRCLIKDYQASVGKLESKEKYADLVAESKLQSIQNAVGNLYYQKRLTQMENQKMGRLQRDLTKTAVIAEQIRDTFLDERIFNIPHYSYQPRLIEGTKKMIMVITDWHIGATVHGVSGNNYNYEIAKKRMSLYKQKVIEQCKLYNITDLHVICLGDMVEHLSMRAVNQAFESEFNFAEQIVKATDLIIELLVNMSEYFNVEYTGISGNHDRTNGDKKANVDGDNVMVIINDSINKFIKYSRLPRLTTTNPDEILYSCVKEINGARIKFVHGDWEVKSSSNKIEAHMAMDEEIYDALVMGHYHHYTVIERNYGKLEVYFGSPMGRNNYSKKIKATSDASQGIIIVHEDGEIEPKRIGLQTL